MFAYGLRDSLVNCSCSSVGDGNLTPSTYTHTELAAWKLTRVTITAESEVKEAGDDFYIHRVSLEESR